MASSHSAHPPVVLAADVGGTKVHLALYGALGEALKPLRDQVYATRDFSSLEELCQDFLRSGPSIAAACFGVPGPVIDGHSRPVNIPWEIDEASLKRALSAPRVKLLNDLEVTAYGVLRLDDSQCEVLQAGANPALRANIAVIAAGTGLGEAMLVPEQNGYRAVASEGGHCDFAPRNAEQVALLEFLARELGHVSFERVLSGPGLMNVYRFLRQRAASSEPPWLAERLAAEEDHAHVIGEAALAGTDPVCVRALEIFVAVYGAEAANLALKTMALGGVFVAGGIAPKILPALRRGTFIEAFNDSGRLSAMLRRIPVRVCLEPAAAVLGAAHVAAAMLQRA